DADGSQPHRRPVAQPGARAEWDAAACVLHLAGRRAAPEPLRVDIDLVRARMRAPFVSASGTVEVRDLVLLRLEDADGYVGCGEAAPLGSEDGISGEDVLAALEDCRTTLMRAARLDRAEILAECSRLGVLPQA